MSKKLKIFLLVVYLMLATAFFLYRLFPSDEVRGHLQYSIKRLNPDLGLRLERIRPALPPGIQFMAANFLYQNRSVLEIDRLKLVPRLFSLFNVQKTIDFKANAYGGIVKGRGHISKAPSGFRIKMNGVVSGIQIRNIAALQKQLGTPLSGILEGRFQLDSGERQRSKAFLTIKDAELELPEAFLAQGRLAFSRIYVEIDAGPQQVRILKSNISGRQLDAQFTGTVALKTPLSQSRINLTGSIKPHPLFLANLKKTYSEDIIPKRRAGKGDFPIRIYNTFETPKFSLRP